MIQGRTRRRKPSGMARWQPIPGGLTHTRGWGWGAIVFVPSCCVCMVAPGFGRPLPESRSHTSLGHMVPPVTQSGPAGVMETEETKETQAATPRGLSVRVFYPSRARAIVPSLTPTTEGS